MSSQKQMRSAFAMIAILYFIRGTFLPYIFQVIQGLSHLSLIQIGGGLTLFTISQAAVGPLVGSLFSSGNPRRPRILIPALFGLLLLATASLKLNWIAPSAAWVLTLSFLGISFTTLRIGFNTTLLKNTPVDKIRSVVSLRATVLNIGAFAGTVLSSYTLDKTGVQ